MFKTKKKKGRVNTVPPLGFSNSKKNRIQRRPLPPVPKNSTYNTIPENHIYNKISPYSSVLTKRPAPPPPRPAGTTYEDLSKPKGSLYNSLYDSRKIYPEYAPINRQDSVGEPEYVPFKPANSQTLYTPIQPQSPDSGISSPVFMNPGSGSAQSSAQPSVYSRIEKPSMYSIMSGRDNIDNLLPNKPEEPVYNSLRKCPPGCVRDPNY